MENFVISFHAFLFQIKIADIFDLQSLKYFGWRLSFLKIWHKPSTNIEIKDCRTCYFGSLDTADNKLIKDKEKQQRTCQYIFLKATMKASVWWKLQAFWPTDHKMTVLWDFCKIERKGHFTCNFCQILEIWQ